MYLARTSLSKRLQVAKERFKNSLGDASVSGVHLSKKVMSFTDNLKKKNLTSRLICKGYEFSLFMTYISN